MKYSCLVFSEGGRDKRFLMALIDLEKFKYHTNKWIFTHDNASGSSPEIILNQCKKSIFGKSYDLILCFIDLDSLKTDYPKKWKEKKIKLESKFCEFVIMWQIDNAEDEYKKVIGDRLHSKQKLNQKAKQEVKKFINSDFWKRILKPIKEKEKELE